jgi:hemerythrin superfamily protein
MRKRRSALSASPASNGVDAIELMKEDHRRLQRMFREFIQLRATNADGESKRAVVERACAVLTVHTLIEEEIFYPAVRDALRDQIVGEEALVEHATAKALIERLEGLEPAEPFYDATFTVLAEYVRHHVEEEETNMFPQAKEAQLDLADLGERMKQRKAELEDDNGPVESGPTDGTEEGTNGNTPPSRRR